MAQIRLSALGLVLSMNLMAGTLPGNTIHQMTPFSVIYNEQVGGVVCDIVVIAIGYGFTRLTNNLTVSVGNG